MSTVVQPFAVQLAPASNLEEARTTVVGNCRRAQNGSAGCWIEFIAIDLIRPIRRRHAFVPTLCGVSSSCDRCPDRYGQRESHSGM
jgi:hypothetical protein